MPSTAPLRLTRRDMAVLEVLAVGRRTGAQLWGLRICELANVGPGTVYPLLDRAIEHGFIHAWWETAVPDGRPPRRFYRLNDCGMDKFDALRADAELQSTRGWRRWWAERGRTAGSASPLTVTWPGRPDTSTSANG